MGRWNELVFYPDEAARAELATDLDDLYISFDPQLFCRKEIVSGFVAVGLAEYTVNSDYTPIQRRRDSASTSYLTQTIRNETFFPNLCQADFGVISEVLIKSRLIRTE